MITPYKQSYLIVMEDGKIIKWTGKAENTIHGKGLAITYATEKTGLQVWDMCNRPVISKN